MTNSQKPVSRSISQTIVFVLSLAVAAGSLQAQSLPREDWEFTQNDRLLRHPLSGGLNTPQVSAVDLNRDGLADLHVFDRVGDKQLAFIYDGSTVDYPYRFAPELLINFPAITRWMLLRDYNGDGIQDIFAYSDRAFDAVMVFTGYHRDDTLAFRRFPFDNPERVIRVPRAGGNSTQLFVSAIDYPAVDDLDCDGDLDILTFNSVGGYVELYANQSVELGYGLDSLIYRLVDNCWGGFFESGISNAVTLAAAPGDCVNRLHDPELEVRHAGSTLLTLDVDGDGDRDLILGDISFDQLNLLTNGGDCDEAWITAQEAAFPSDDVAVDVPVFPAAFYLDVDNDQRRDLLVAPNAAVGGLNREALWWYRNMGTDEIPDFQLQQKDFLIEEMIDLGTGAHPAVVDYNADGLLDLVIGNNSFYEPLGAKNARLFLYENTGDRNRPAFTLVDDDYLSLNVFSQSATDFSPAFGDLDGDGDLDAVIGEQNGRLFFAENLAGAGRPFEFAAARYNYMDIHVGQTSSPQLVDLNRDGLLDLIVGERNGNINYFQNQGSTTDPVFTADPSLAPNVEVLGGVDTRTVGFSTGYSTPVVVEIEGAYHLLTGTQLGNLELYAGIGNNLSLPFTLLEDHFGNLAVGERTHPALAEMDSDGLLELIVGNLSGGITIFQTDLPAPMSVPVTDIATSAPEWQLFPNPASRVVYFRTSRPLSVARILIWNAQGQLMRDEDLGGLTSTWSVTHWPAGIYWVQVRTAAGSSTQKLIIEP